MGFLNKIFKGNTLYYPGCLTKFALRNIQKNYEKILRDEGVDFIMLKDKELCCGSPVKNAGEKKEFEELARKNLKIFKDHSVDRVITNCPACAQVFKKDYKEILGKEWDVEVRHITEIMSDRENLKKSSGEVTYHDPCHLGRSLGIYEKPRKIIQGKGYKIKEMKLNRNESYCCGGGGGVKSNAPKLSNRIAQDRIDQAKKLKVGKLVTTCPMCYLNLKNNSKSEDLDVKELSEL